MTRSIHLAGISLALVLSFTAGGCPGPEAALDPNTGAPSGDPGGDVAGDGIQDSTPADPENTAPVATIAVQPEQTVTPGQEVTLDASGSSDPDGDALTFAWSQIEGPALEPPEGPVFTFAAPLVLENTPLRISVTVTDGRGGSATAEASLTVVAGGEFSGHPQGLTPYRTDLTRDEAYHLLRRIAFGAQPDQVDWAAGVGPEAVVDSYLVKRELPNWIHQLAASYEDDIPARWMVHLLESPNPLHERMSLFWHDRFATSRRVLESRDRNLAVQHWELLRAHALGNYRAFLEALTLDPLMLIWLDAGDSPRDNPNENYIREFWELFTLGRDTLYTEEDIREGARALTGITLYRPPDKDLRPVFDVYEHDRGDKAIFPERASAANHDYATVIDLTLEQPEAAEYVARNLFVFFVHDHPSDDVVQELAADFVEANFEIAPLVRKILVSQAMFSPDARGNQISTPVEHWVGVARTLAMHMHSEDSQGYVLDRVTDDLAGAGLDLLNPADVDGWEEDEGWLEDQWIINRVRALGRTMEYGSDRTPDLPYHLLPPVSRWDEREVRDEIVDAIADVFHLELTDEERTIYTEVLDQNGWRAFHLTEPDYQPQHVFEMIRLMAMDERVIGR